MPKRSLLPADGGDGGLFSGDARADLFNNDLSDLLGKLFGNFHILQHMARFGNGIRGGRNLGGDDGFKHDRDHLAGFSGLAVHAVDFLERDFGGDFDVGSRLSDRGFSQPCRVQISWGELNDGVGSEFVSNLLRDRAL